MTIRVVLGDDNLLVREGVRALLGVTPDIEVVAVAEDAPSLLAAAAEHRPDVVVTDIKMPPNFRLEGIEAAHEIQALYPGTGVVVLSAVAVVLRTAPYWLRRLGRWQVASSSQSRERRSRPATATLQSLSGTSSR